MIKSKFDETEYIENQKKQIIEDDIILEYTPTPPIRRRGNRRAYSRSESLNLDLTPARLTRSLSMTSLEDLEELNTILDTVVTERGANLSGGLAQSVALARVYVRKQASIVILDESIGQMG